VHHGCDCASVFDALGAFLLSGKARAAMPACVYFAAVDDPAPDCMHGSNEQRLVGCYGTCWMLELFLLCGLACVWSAQSVSCLLVGCCGHLGLYCCMHG
jgi:hypothetical protein